MTFDDFVDAITKVKRGGYPSQERRYLRTVYNAVREGVVHELASWQEKQTTMTTEEDNEQDKHSDAAGRSEVS